MTLTLRDLSDYDQDPIDFAGLVGITHKATEGTMPHADAEATKLVARMAAAHAAGLPVLGAYHVLRTPGSPEVGGTAGTLAQQLAYWVARLDDQVPWWRTWPHWVMQIDAEKWSYDNLAASTVLQFADLLATSGLPGWKVTYASRGQYGDSLTGIATPLWNADYRAGTYPGDTAVATDKGAVGFWAPYSGQTPVLLQWNGGPDLNAYRGTLTDLTATMSGQHPEGTDMLHLNIARTDGTNMEIVTDGFGRWRWLDAAALAEINALGAVVPYRQVTEQLALDAYGVNLNPAPPAPPVTVDTHELATELMGLLAAAGLPTTTALHADFVATLNAAKLTTA